MDMRIMFRSGPADRLPVPADRSVHFLVAGALRPLGLHSFKVGTNLPRAALSNEQRFLLASLEGA